MAIPQENINIMTFIISGLRILAAVIIGFVGWYFVVNARRACKGLSDDTSRFRPPLSVLFPSRLHNSKAFIFVMKLMGCIGLLISAVLFGMIISNWTSR
jgi:hypothetical protein